MAKKRTARSPEDVRLNALVGHGEIDSTRAYANTLKEVYHEKGLLAATGYEIKSTLYSLGKRIANIFGSIPGPTEAERMPLDSGGVPGSYRGGGPTSDAVEARGNRLEKKSQRRAERVAYILRHQKKETSSGLEGAAATAAIIGIVAGLFFLSNNITGNVIGNMTNSTSNIIGAVFVLVALVGGFFWFRNRK